MDCFLAQCDYQSGVSRGSVSFYDGSYFCPSAFGLYVSTSPFTQLDSGLQICTDFNGHDKKSGFSFGGHLISSSSVDFLFAFNSMLTDLSSLIVKAGSRVSDIDASLLFGPSHYSSQHLNIYDLVVSYGFNVTLVYGAKSSDNFLINHAAGVTYLVGDSKKVIIPRVVDKSFLCNSSQSPSLDCLSRPISKNVIKPVSRPSVSEGVFSSLKDEIIRLKKISAHLGAFNRLHLLD
ncbi:MAG TPA: hypothetical protein VI790_00655 [Candidatus Nanoarchaeia archaeon]|nr:hypothetical protein [Candidatus Nanoarchaeia archaeon]